jgi:8-oxo-dGTP pyrophosphatase MutT (NUDIX family)
MNDSVETGRSAVASAATRGVRPRDAASLILLRGEGRDVELLVGRRPRHVRFMPGVWVFPGGALDREDGGHWGVETGEQSLPPRLLRCARAALRETWEETGVLFGRKATLAPTTTLKTAIAAAYADAGVAATIDLLSYVGRAITPARVFRRFNTRFFLGDGDAAVGNPQSSDELEDVCWHPIGRHALDPFRDVSQFMLERAIALRSGEIGYAPPLFYTVNGTRRYGVCREAMPVL